MTSVEVFRLQGGTKSRRALMHALGIARQIISTLRTFRIFSRRSPGVFHETRFEPLYELGRAFLSVVFWATAHAEESDKSLVSRTAEIDGVELHYLTAGHGAPLILLHGYAETSLMWRPIMPVLAERFTVIAPDLPNIGDSAVPAIRTLLERLRRRQDSLDF